MIISDSVYRGLQETLRQCFTLNAKFDNRAYSLGYHYYNNIEDIYHHGLAHLVTGDKWADFVSSLMLKVNARPVRLNIPENYDKDYNDLKELFHETTLDLTNFSKLVANVIEEAEMGETPGDVQIKIALENFLEGEVLMAVKQAYEWENAANVLDYHTMNTHIADYTHYISFPRELTK